MAYPVTISVNVQTGERNRVTTLLRPILATPHWILVGPAWPSRWATGGLLAGAAYVMAVVSWFTLLVADKHLPGIRDFSLYYLRWRTRALAYMALFTDDYPPFGDDNYPATIDVSPPPLPRDRTSIAVRLLLAVPHFVLLFFLMIAWFVTTLIAWVAILNTGKYPPGLANFGLGVMRWLLRVEAYVLLLVDEYPPFEFD